MKRTETTSIEPTGQDVGSCKITSIEPDNQGGIGCGIISIEPELRKAITGSITMRLQNLQEELKKDPKNKQIREQIAEIRRELNRTKQYSNITQENSKKLIGSKNIDTASAATLIKIDREEWGRGEFLSRSFLYKQTKDSGGNIYEEPSNGKDLREWDTLLVDFGKNKNAYNLIGLGHMLTADIGYIKVNWKIGIRSIINNRVGYYTQANPSWYIPIFTWDIVTLPTTSEIGAFEKQKDSSLRRNSNQNESNKANDLYLEKKIKTEAFQGFKKMEDLSPEEKATLADIPSNTLSLWKNEYFGKRFIPGSKEAQQLFTFAAVMAWLPKRWWASEDLHYILSNESGGVVWRPNYKLSKANINGQELKNTAMKNGNIAGKNIARLVDVDSTAIGLGQLTLSNEEYLPNWRNSIGIPLEEAIGMLRYIKDRYGSIEIARNMYGRTWFYTHPDSGIQMKKSFLEGY